MLDIQGVSASFNGEVFLKDITLQAEPGHIYVLLGRTGAGKSSLMRAVGGLLPLDAGTIHFAGEDITQKPVWKRDAALVYQQFINYPNKTVRANVEFPLRKLKLSRVELNLRVDTYLKKVGLFDFANRRPSQLSGGQQQRVALARSLARQSKILMLDEPLMNLDFKLREQLREEFLDLVSVGSQAVTFYATTEITEAMMLGYQVVVMHEGSILQIGSPSEVFESPRNTLVAQIVNDPPMTLIQARVTEGNFVLGSNLTIPLPVHLRNLGDGEYTFGIRANDLVPAVDSAASESCSIQFVEVSGSETVLYVTSPSGEIVVQLEGIHDFSAGGKIELEIAAERLFAFDHLGDLLIAPGIGVK